MLESWNANKMEMKLEVPTEENSIYYLGEDEQEMIEYHHRLILFSHKIIEEANYQIQFHQKQVKKIMEG